MTRHPTDRRDALRLTVAAVLAGAGLAARAGSYDDYFRAIDIDAPHIVADLLRRGFDPNARDERGQVGLYLALRSPSPKVAEVLWSHPQLDFDAPNNAGETPLMMAAMKGEVDWVRRLIARGARINKPGWNAMHYGAIAPDQRVMQLLLANGGDIAARSPNGTTPLMMAARNGDERTVDLLLQRGADPTARNDRNLSAADLALSQDRDNLAARLQKLTR
ncbi:ankyrin repeat domain-containing protein [Aquincola sp. MAHUQ-54]|uniref:Ankyrin repeat domain-containing protein n=1 Tax=Aquincola agrisoli TaxID=3119538 RepID=A0AAW9Q7R3_9BURK